MQIKTSSGISGCLTASLIAKIIGSKELMTTIPMMAELLVDFVSDVKTDEKIKAVKQPQFWFVNTSTVDWKTAEKDIFSSLSWNNLKIGEPTETEFIIEDLILETSVKDTAGWVYELFLEHNFNFEGLRLELQQDLTKQWIQNKRRTNCK